MGKRSEYHGHTVVSVEDFLEFARDEFDLDVVSGGPLLDKRRLTSSKIQKLGLALAGPSHFIHLGRMQVIGQSEVTYLEGLGQRCRKEAVEGLDLGRITCLLITKGLSVPEAVGDVFEREGVPVLRTSLGSSQAIKAVREILQRRLAPSETVHGVLLGMYGLGVLIRGKSGIGKSECALDLVNRGHGLVSDDSVVVRRLGDQLEGASPEMTFGHLEIRGLGIISVRDLLRSFVGRGVEEDRRVHRVEELGGCGRG